MTTTSQSSLIILKSIFKQDKCSIKRDLRCFVIGNIMAATNYGQVDNDSFFNIVEKNSLERVDEMSGRCLSFRKTILNIKIQINHLAIFIITSKVFDGVVLTFILLNSI